VQEGYDNNGPPPWAASPAWTNVGTQATVPVYISPISLVQSNNATGAPSNTSTISVNWSANTTSGRLLVAAVAWSSTTINVTSVKYGTTSWTAGPTIAQGSQRIQLFYLSNAAAETTATPVTVTYSNKVGSRAVIIAEFSGLSSTTTQDVSGTSTNAASVTSDTVSTSAATTAANELAVIAVNNSVTGATRTFTPPQTWMDVDNTGTTSGITVGLEWSLTGATGVFTGSDTWSPAATDAMVLSVFKP
jgi:hypothetical protein